MRADAVASAARRAVEAGVRRRRERSPSAAITKRACRTPPSARTAKPFRTTDEAAGGNAAPDAGAGGFSSDEECRVEQRTADAETVRGRSPPSGAVAVCAPAMKRSARNSQASVCSARAAESANSRTPAGKTPSPHALRRCSRERSMRRTSWPSRARWMAAAAPATLPPTIRTSCMSVCDLGHADIRRSRGVGRGVAAVGGCPTVARSLMPLTTLRRRAVLSASCRSCLWTPRSAPGDGSIPELAGTRASSLQGTSPCSRRTCMVWIRPFVAGSSVRGCKTLLGIGYGDGVAAYGRAGAASTRGSDRSARARERRGYGCAAAPPPLISVCEVGC